MSGGGSAVGSKGVPSSSTSIVTDSRPSEGVAPMRSRKTPGSAPAGQAFRATFVSTSSATISNWVSGPGGQPASPRNSSMRATSATRSSGSRDPSSAS